MKKANKYEKDQQFVLKEWQREFRKRSQVEKGKDYLSSCDIRKLGFNFTRSIWMIALQQEGSHQMQMQTHFENHNRQNHL